MEYVLVFILMVCFVAVFVAGPMYRKIMTLKAELKLYKDKERAAEIKKIIYEGVKAHMEHANLKERRYAD